MPTQEMTSSAAILDALRRGDLNFGEYIDQLESHFNSQEPDILAFIPEEGHFERLRKEANGLEELYPDPEARPPMFGLPIGVKDIFHVDGFETHAGSSLPAEILHGVQANCVTVLKEAGAIVFGKTVTTEFAYFAPGPTRNPHNFEHTPGGSSSGSAAAVAAGLVPLALGTQTIGSITRPASYCGVFGFKPSYARISNSGIIPLAPSLDHVGLFANNISLIQTAASILYQDWGDHPEISSKPVLAIPEGPYLQKASEEMLQHFHEVVTKLERAGYQVVQIHTMQDIEEIALRHDTILAAEAAHTHKDWYKKYEGIYHSKTRELIERGMEIPQTQFLSALEGLKIFREQLMNAMNVHNIDLWLSPSSTGAAPKGLGSTGDPVMNLPWTQSGLPTLNIPTGMNEKGLPLGMQVTAGWYQDEQLLSWADGLIEIIN